MKAVRCEAIITSIRSRADRSLGLGLSTPELSSEEKVALMDLQNILVDFLVIPKDENDPELVIVEKEMDLKTPSQRLRAVLFLLFKAEQQKGKKDTFDGFYNRHMEKLIEFVKSKIDEKK
jgi:hypothetical protein